MHYMQMIFRKCMNDCTISVKANWAHQLQQRMKQ